MDTERFTRYCAVTPGVYTYNPFGPSWHAGFKKVSEGIAATVRSGYDVRTSDTTSPVCPHCFSVTRDTSVLELTVDEEGRVTKCQHCDKPFKTVLHIVSRYSTFKDDA